MARLRRFFLRLINVIRPGRAEPDLARELSSHLALLEEDFERRGMTPDEAHLAARRAFGGLAQAKERHRDARSFAWLDDARNDLRYAARSLARNPGFTTVAVLTLAIGIGANTTIFSIVNAAILRPLPFANPDRLVRIVENVPAAESRNGQPARVPNLTSADLLEVRARTRTLSHVALYSSLVMTLTGRGDPVRVSVGQVSASTLPMLGVQPVLGRLFDEQEERPGANDVIVLSYGAWQRYFDGKPAALTETITFEAQNLANPTGGTPRTFRVIGVMPRTFSFPNRETAFWLPLVARPAASGQTLRVGATMARVKDGLALESAAAEMNEIFRQMRGLPAGSPVSDGRGARIEVVPVKDEQSRPVRAALQVLIVAVGFVLLIACTNIANLLLARAGARRHEMAIRASIGASRGRLVRQVLTESAGLSLAGGLAGIALAYFGMQLFVAQWPGNVNPSPSSPRFDEVAFDATVLAFTGLISILTGLVFGLAPALRVSATDPSEAIKVDADRGATRMTLARISGRRVLVVGEVGMAMVLLVGAGLLLRSFVKLSSVNPGFDPSNVLTFSVVYPPTSMAPQGLRDDQLVDMLRRLPEVTAAGFSMALPFGRSMGSGPRFEIPGVPNGTLSGVSLRFLPVSRDYLRAVGVRLVAGRGFDERDGPGRPLVIVVNRELARFFPSRNPVGYLVNVGSPPVPVEVVGVVDDVRQSGLDSEPEPQYFMDLRQYVPLAPPMLRALFGGVFAVRAAGEPLSLVPAVRRAVTQIDSGAALDNVTTLERIVSDSIATPRFYAVLLTLFAVISVALAAIGIYGLIAYTVAQRTREIGIRMALGAKRADVLGMVLGQSLLLTLVGIALGVAGAAAVTRYLERLLFGLTPLDPATFAVVSLLFAAVATLAAYVPARRATRVDPLVALRCE